MPDPVSDSKPTPNPLKLLAVIVTSSSGSASLTAPRNIGIATDDFGGLDPHARQRTPRKSLIVAIPDNHCVSPEEVAARLAGEREIDAVDVILACAGEPHAIAALQRRIRDLQVLLAPAGTSVEDLRALAMEQASGDIVTLLSGTPVS